PHEDPLLDDFCELVTTGLQRRPGCDHALKSRDGGAEHAAVHLPVPSTPQRLVEVGRDHRSLARPENTALSAMLTARAPPTSALWSATRRRAKAPGVISPSPRLRCHTAFLKISYRSPRRSRFRLRLVGEVAARSAHTPSPLRQKRSAAGGLRPHTGVKAAPYSSQGPDFQTALAWNTHLVDLDPAGQNFSLRPGPPRVPADQR